MPEPIRYTVDLSRRAQHLVEVTVTVPEDLAGGARLTLPVWTPGSYVVRDYVHHLQRIDADVTLGWDGRSAWRLPDGTAGPVDVRLELYANELTVRTNHVDDHHALLVPAAMFPSVDVGRDRQHVVTVAAPEGWRVWSLLPDGDAPGTFVADGYDHLVDSAFEAGDHAEVDFEVADVTHRFVYAGHGGRPDLDRVATDARRIAEQAVELFGGDLPVDRYTFLCTAWDQGGGGLEHRDGAVLSWPVHAFAEPEGYRRFVSLVAHEYLHLWNVKRLRPAALTQLDYERPVHTPSLWVAEGWTAYYDELLPLRAGVWPVRAYLDRTGETVQRVLDRPGRRLQSVRQASHEAWTKFYIRDENSPNVGVSYYEHGAVLALCLDLAIRRSAPESDGLDDVLRALWERFGRSDEGYEEEDVEGAVAEVADADLGGFFHEHVGGTEDPPVDDLLDVVGLRRTERRPEDEPAAPELGVEISEDDDGVTLASVLRDRAAWNAGLTGGDRLLAVDRTRVRRGELRKVLLGYRPGDQVEVTVFRGPRLVTAEVTLGVPRPPRRLEPVEDPTDAQREAFRRWARRDLDDAGQR